MIVYRDSEPRHVEPTQTNRIGTIRGHWGLSAGL